jgi:hypothetical protein
MPTVCPFLGHVVPWYGKVGPDGVTPSRCVRCGKPVT